MVSMVLLCVSAGTGEGDVGDAEKLLQPYLKKYPKVGPEYPSVGCGGCVVKESGFTICMGCMRNSAVTVITKTRSYAESPRETERKSFCDILRNLQWCGYGEI